MDEPLVGKTHRQRRRDLIVSPIYGVVPLDFLGLGDEHDCPYLPGLRAREEFFLTGSFPGELYHDFMDHGFRRSGTLFYRTACPTCDECRPIRIPVNDFVFKKSYRRILKHNDDIRVTVGPPKFSAEKSRLYRSYLTVQHGQSNQNVPGNLRRFLYTSPVESIEFEYRLNGRLVAVGITDRCSRSLSSVYTYFDPEHAERSLGTFSALFEIRYCEAEGIPHYYLGFYVRECPSMNYKARYRPHEILDTSGRWNRR
jgi:leucyl-tRNA---protein transferase